MTNVNRCERLFSVGGMESPGKMPMIKIQITYQTTTEDSLEDGDFADHGFYDCGGWRYSISAANESFRDRVASVGHFQAIKAQTPKPVEFDTVAEAIEFLENSGPFESVDQWLTAGVIQDRDYFEKGESTSLSYHLECDESEKAEILSTFA